MSIIRKQYDFASQRISKSPDGGSGPGGFEGYGAVYGNVDRDNEIIAPGAFAESLATFIRDGFIACAHEWEEGVATITDAYEDGYGLYIKCEFHSDDESQALRIKTMERIERGKTVGLSVGFTVDEWSYDEESGVRTITKATLYEVSIVTVPANALAQVVSAKSGRKLPATVREFEGFLRDVGFPKEKACAIASKGFACGMQAEPTIDDDQGDEMETLYLQIISRDLGVEI